MNQGEPTDAEIEVGLRRLTDTMVGPEKFGLPSDMTPHEARDMVHKIGYWQCWVCGEIWWRHVNWTCPK